MVVTSKGERVFVVHEHVTTSVLMQYIHLKLKWPQLQSRTLNGKFDMQVESTLEGPVFPHALNSTKWLSCCLAGCLF